MPFSKISYENIQDYLRWIVPGFVTLFLLFDILPESFREAEILLPSGIILSIFIYAVTHLISNTEYKKISIELNKNGLMAIVEFFVRTGKFLTVGRNYEHHIKKVTETAKGKGIIEDNGYNYRQLLELCKICQDKNLPEYHESTHKYTSYYWLFSCSALAAFLSIPLRFFRRYYSSISNCSSLKSIDWASLFSLKKFAFYPTDIFAIIIAIGLIIIFRWFATEFAKRITEVDVIIIDIISSKFKK